MPMTLQNLLAIQRLVEFSAQREDIQRLLAEVVKKLIALSVLLTSCVLSHAAEPLVNVAWLQGCWAVEGAEAGSGEQWSSPAGGVMLGAGRTVRGGKMVEHEYMQLREIDGKLSFVALIPGQPQVVFTLRPGGGEELVFENIKHDFPQRVIYRKTDPQHLNARIEGTIKGKLQTESFPMKRAKCEG
jgi:hypothetical protein